MKNHVYCGCRQCKGDGPDGPDEPEPRRWVVWFEASETVLAEDEDEAKKLALAAFTKRLEEGMGVEGFHTYGPTEEEEP